MPSSGFQQSPSDFLDYDEFVLEYQSAAKTFEDQLPPRAVMPLTPLQPRPSEPMLFERGAGQVEALFAWLHIIERAVVEAVSNGNRADAQRWTRVAARFCEHETFQRFNDHDAPVSWHEAVIVPALRGDYSALVDEYRTNARHGRL